MLTIATYAQEAARTDRLAEAEPDLAFPLLGVFGETGSLLSEVKKKQRDPTAYIGYEASVLEEFGDVLWYVAAVARRAGLELSWLFANAGDRDPDAHATLNFSDLQAPSAQITWIPQPTADFERTLLRLSAEVGLIMVDFDAGRLDRNKWALAGRLVSMLRTLTAAADDAGITLADAATENLRKIKDRWPDERHYPPPFDLSFPIHEQFARTMVFEIREIDMAKGKVSQISMDGQPLGDPLTDNRQDDDDYRFHDVFHMAYAAVLGWSPTLRRLLKRKRKSDARIDETQDGARAVLIEEGIATWIFNHAQRLELFANVNSLDYAMLKSVKEFVRGYEAERCPLWAWEEAILQGYVAFRAVKMHRSGRLHLDLDSRALTFEPLE